MGSGWLRYVLDLAVRSGMVPPESDRSASVFIGRGYLVMNPRFDD